MRILYVDVNYGESSTGKIVQDLAKGAIEKGHLATVAYGRGIKSKDYIGFKFAFDLETYFHAFMARITGINGHFSPISTHRLIRYIKRTKPELVHLHDLHGYYLNFGRIINYLKKNKIRTFFTFHSEFMYTGKCGHAKGCNKFELTCHQCPQLKEYPKSYLLDFTKLMHSQKKNYFDGFNNLKIIVPSEWMKKRVQRSFLSDLDIKVIYNGVDTKLFNIVTKEKSSKIRILSVINDIHDPIKGYNWFIKIANHFKELEFSLLSKNAHIKDLPSNVTLIKGPLKKESMPSIYNGSDALLMISQYESFSMVTSEAIACGVPVIGFAVGGVPEATYGNTDYLVDYGSNRIYEMISDFISSYMNKIVNYDKYQISIERMIDEHMEYYEN